jgi:phytanoyl-CoA hydroxylase
MALSPAQLKQYLEEGYVAVESLFDPQALAPLIAEFEAAIDTKARALHSQGQLKDLHAAAPFETRLALLCRDAEPEAAQELWRVGQGKHHKTAGMFAVWTQPALLDVVEQVIGPEILAHPQFNSRAKLPNQEETIVPWHQDIGYLEREADDTFMVNFWIPLVDAPMETGALQVIPGSHRWDVLPHERIGIYDGLREESLPAHEVVDCPLQLGGALLIHSRTTHRSVANTTDIVRWSLDLRYCDWRQPTGRPDIPGFVARSAKHPEKVAQSVEDWLQLFADDTAGLDPHAR